jgi:hypothetical protein
MEGRSGQSGIDAVLARRFAWMTGRARNGDVVTERGPLSEPGCDQA